MCRGGVSCDGAARKKHNWWVWKNGRRLSSQGRKWQMCVNPPRGRSRAGGCCRGLPQLKGMFLLNINLCCSFGFDRESALVKKVRGEEKPRVLDGKTGLDAANAGKGNIRGLGARGPIWGKLMLSWVVFCFLKAIETRIWRANRADSGTCSIILGNRDRSE